MANQILPADAVYTIGLSVAFALSGQFTKGTCSAQVFFELKGNDTNIDVYDQKKEAVNIKLTAFFPNQTVAVLFQQPPDYARSDMNGETGRPSGLQDYSIFFIIGQMHPSSLLPIFITITYWKRKSFGHKR